MNKKRKKLKIEWIYDEQNYKVRTYSTVRIGDFTLMALSNGYWEIRMGGISYDQGKSKVENIKASQLDVLNHFLKRISKMKRQAMRLMADQ